MYVWDKNVFSMDERKAKKRVGRGLKYNILI